MSERPDWFLGFFEEAIQMTSVSDEFVESALGIGCTDLTSQKWI